jgi:hypothetical protein
MVKNIPVQEAVGKVLFHDNTRISPGEFKGLPLIRYRTGDLFKCISKSS